MKTLLSTGISLLIECRDYRIPLTSLNPLFEAELSGSTRRLILYTKRDLGFADDHNSRAVKEREDRIKTLMMEQGKGGGRVEGVMFASNTDRSSIGRILAFIRDHAQARDTLTGTRCLVLGMPNVGKSSLLNSLRHTGTGRGKAASTGAQPGITRKIGTAVKIIEGEAEDHEEDVYVMDTPGVFVPYVPDAEAMLKLALCGCVKDTIVPPVMLADYLLYQVNKVGEWGCYTCYTPGAEPTNDVMTLLEGVARRTGRLMKGGMPDVEAAALWVVQRWRGGFWGRFILDDVSEEGIEMERAEREERGGSMNQARRVDKEARRARGRAIRDAG